MVAAEVESGGSIAGSRTAEIGASLPLDAGATNDEVCPFSDLPPAPGIDRLKR